MNLEATLLEIKKDLKELKSLSRPKTTWVTASWITDLTGWNGEKLRQAREQGIVKFKRRPSGGFDYLLESVPEQLIKKVNDNKAA